MARGHRRWRPGRAEPGHRRAGPGAGHRRDITDADHRLALVAAAVELGGGIDLLVHNASHLGPSPQPRLAAYPLDAFARVYEVNVLAPLALTQVALPVLRPRRPHPGHQLRRRRRGHDGWGGYGSSKAALEHLFAVLAVEHPELRVHRVDPGDMNTRMHQAASGVRARQPPPARSAARSESACRAAAKSSCSRPTSRATTAPSACGWPGFASRAAARLPVRAWATGALRL